MLENSGLVLGVDSSLGLLTWLDNPRYVGVALLVHGRLLHLTQKETRESGNGEKHYKEGKREAEKYDKNIIFSDVRIQIFENTSLLYLFILVDLFLECML